MSSVQKQDDTAQQLMVLKAATNTTGILHDAQILQLRMWGHLALQHLKPFTFQPLPNERSVTYRAPGLSKEKASKKVVATRLDLLERNVKWLLGDDWSVVVEVAGTAIYPVPPDVKRTRSK